MTLALSLGGLTACSSLPVIPPEMSTSHAPVRLEGARGPLKQQQSKAILDRLAASSKRNSLFA